MKTIVVRDAINLLSLWREHFHDSTVYNHGGTRDTMSRTATAGNGGTMTLSYFPDKPCLTCMIDQIFYSKTIKNDGRTMTYHLKVEEQNGVL